MAFLSAANLIQQMCHRGFKCARGGCRSSADRARPLSHPFRFSQPAKRTQHQFSVKSTTRATLAVEPACPLPIRTLPPHTHSPPVPGEGRPHTARTCRASHMAAGGPGEPEERRSGGRRRPGKPRGPWADITDGCRLPGGRSGGTRQAAAPLPCPPRPAHLHAGVVLEEEEHHALVDGVEAIVHLAVEAGGQQGREEAPSAPGQHVGGRRAHHDGGGQDVAHGVGVQHQRQQHLPAASAPPASPGHPHGQRRSHTAQSPRRPHRPPRRPDPPGGRGSSSSGSQRREGGKALGSPAHGSPRAASATILPGRRRSNAGRKAAPRRLRGDFREGQAAARLRPRRDLRGRPPPPLPRLPWQAWPAVRAP